MISGARNNPVGKSDPWRLITPQVEAGSQEPGPDPRFVGIWIIDQYGVIFPLRGCLMPHRRAFALLAFVSLCTDTQLIERSDP